MNGSIRTTSPGVAPAAPGAPVAVTGPRQTVLVVEDDRKTGDLVQLYLEREGYCVLRAADGPTGLDLALAEAPDLVLLDLMLPGLDGVTLCEALRARSTVPVIMLTARTTEDDKVAGLEAGADDYVAKPFSPRELVARARAVLRRAGADGEPAGLVAVGDLTVNLAGHAVQIGDRPVDLTPREFRLLATLARAPGRAFTRQELLERVCGVDYEGLDRTLDVHVMNLRKKIEPDPARPAYLLTVYGVGYKLVPPDAP